MTRAFIFFNPRRWWLKVLAAGVPLIFLGGAFSVASPLKKGGFTFHFEGTVATPPNFRTRDVGSVELARESYYLFIPAAYDGSESYGLVAFIHARDEVSVPPGWSQVLSDKKLLYLAAQNVGNDQKASRRSSVTLAGILKMRELYHLDAKRVYLAGFSGGARVASMTAFRHPGLIAGVVCNCGVDFVRLVPRHESTRTDDYGVFSCDPSLAAKARQTEKFALITGSDDFRRGNIRDIYAGGFVPEGFQARLWDIPGMGHRFCSGAIFREAIDFLESPP